MTTLLFSVWIQWCKRHCVHIHIPSLWMAVCPSMQCSMVSHSLPEKWLNDGRVSKSNMLWAADNDVIVFQSPRSLVYLTANHTPLSELPALWYLFSKGRVFTTTPDTMFLCKWEAESLRKTFVLLQNVGI